ncbi:MAG: COR domain-containing protein, partial [Bacteroidia bacterium]
LEKLIRAGLTVKWESWGRVNGIYLKDNPLSTPPKEIIGQGNKAILQYLKNTDTERLYEGKLLIVGEGGAGKTTLRNLIARVEENVVMKTLSSIAKLISSKKNEGEECSTRGIDVVRHRFEREAGKPFIINIWDFGGQQIYHATHRFFLSERALYIVVMDLRRDSDGFDYWLESVEKFGKESPVLVLLNQKADRQHFAIDEGNIRKRFKHVKAISSINLRSEAQKDKEALAKFIQQIQFEMQHLPLVGSVIPKTWKELREKIAALAKNSSTIEKHEYEQLCKVCGITDKEEMQVLSRYFHDLGVFLHFHESPLLKHLVILQNTWATDAVYKLIDDEKIIKQEGRFQKKQAEKVWQASEYREKCAELLELMTKFELLYEVPNKKTHYIMPQLLKDKVPDGLNWQDSKDDLVIRYEYDFMPKGLITHIIVRLHEYIENHEMVWQKGSVFHIQDARAKIYAQYGNRVIELRAQGRNRKELAALLSNDIDKLNATFEKLGEKKKVPCNCRICEGAEKPYMFTYQLLYANHKNGTAKIICENEGEGEAKTMLYGNFTPEPIQKVRALIAEGKLEDALAYLAHLTGKANEVTYLQSRHAQNEQQRSMLSHDEYQRCSNLITKETLDLVNRLDEDDAWRFSMRMGKHGGEFEREMRGEFIRIRAKLDAIQEDTQAIKITLTAHQQKLLSELQGLSSEVRYAQSAWEKQLSQFDEKQTLAIQRMMREVEEIKDNEGKNGLRKMLQAVEAEISKQGTISKEIESLLKETQKSAFDMDTQLKLKIPLIPSILEIEHSIALNSGQNLVNWWRDLKNSIFG